MIKGSQEKMASIEREKAVGRDGARCVPLIPPGWGTIPGRDPSPTQIVLSLKRDKIASPMSRAEMSFLLSRRHGSAVAVSSTFRLGPSQTARSLNGFGRRQIVPSSSGCSSAAKG